MIFLPAWQTIHYSPKFWLLVLLLLLPFLGTPSCFFTDPRLHLLQGQSHMLPAHTPIRVPRMGPQGTQQNLKCNINFKGWDEVINWKANVNVKSHKDWKPWKAELEMHWGRCFRIKMVNSVHYRKKPATRTNPGTASTSLVTIITLCGGEFLGTA